jgi:hypothetical protein
MVSSSTNQVEGHLRAVARSAPTCPSSPDTPSRPFSIEEYVRQSTDASNVPLRVQDVRTLIDIANMLALHPQTRIRTRPADIAS